MRNWGVSGQSVYQMYVRMKRQEQSHPGRLLIVNIYSDDHHRNLYAWSSLRLMTRHPDVIREGIHRPTMPFVEVDLADGTITERENPCPTGESLMRLSDPDWVYDSFNDHFPVRVVVARAALGRRSPETNHADHRADRPRLRAHAAAPTAATRPRRWRPFTSKLRSSPA